MVILETSDYRAEFAASIKYYEEGSGEYDSFREERLFYKGTAAIIKKSNGEKVIFSFSTRSVNKEWGRSEPSLEALILKRRSEARRIIPGLNDILGNAFSRVKDSKDTLPSFGFE